MFHGPKKRAPGPTAPPQKPTPIARPAGGRPPPQPVFFFLFLQGFRPVRGRGHPNPRKMDGPPSKLMGRLGVLVSLLFFPRRTYRCGRKARPAPRRPPQGPGWVGPRAAVFHPAAHGTLRAPPHQETPPFFLPRFPLPGRRPKAAGKTAKPNENPAGRVSPRPFSPRTPPGGPARSPPPTLPKNPFKGPTYPPPPPTRPVSARNGQSTFTTRGPKPPPWL